jgi:hypothetical protein
MRKFAFPGFLMIAIILIILSCSKDVDLFVPDEVIIPDPEPIGDINNFFAELKGDFETSYDLPCIASLEYVILPSGTVIPIDPNQFDLPVDIDCNANGGRPLKMTVTEIDSKGEIIMAGKQTVSDGRLLESRAEYFIEVTYNEQPVKLKEGIPLRILVEDDTPVQRMELFYGGMDENGFNWEQADGDDNTWDGAQVNEWALQDSSQNLFGFGYECWSDSLNWINVDIFQDVPEDQRTSACISLPENFTNTNTVAFIVFTDFNGVVAMPGDSATMQFCEPYSLTPIGYNVTFIVISEQGEDCYFFGQASAVIQENHVEFIDPQKMPLEDIIQILNAL